ncbi:MAG: class I SAM-dependent methyltransferase [Bacillota bacterium]
MDLLKLNRAAWNKEVQSGNPWTRPVSPEVIAEARHGRWSLLLTPTKPVPAHWYPPLPGAKVLCLASGGGQQGPVLAAAGADVTVLDNSPAQLAQDQLVAEREGLAIRLELGDMRDLSRFGDETFDLVFHPVSNCFVDDVLPVWRECFRVLKRGGALLAGFVNPLLYIFDIKEWDDHGRLVVRHSIPFSDLRDLPAEEIRRRIENCKTVEFGHTLEDQIGGQIAAGFVITGFYEDTSGGDLLDSYISTFIATKAVKL